MKQGTRVYADSTVKKKIAGEAISRTHGRIFRWHEREQSSSTKSLPMVEQSTPSFIVSSPLRPKIEINPRKRTNQSLHLIEIIISSRGMIFFLMKLHYISTRSFFKTPTPTVFYVSRSKKRQGVIISLIISPACWKRKEKKNGGKIKASKCFVSKQICLTSIQCWKYAKSFLYA